MDEFVIRGSIKEETPLIQELFSKLLNGKMVWVRGDRLKLL